MNLTPWSVDQLKILTRSELAHVLDDLGERSLSSVSGRMNRVIFRLACCCGLRVSELGALRIADLVIGVSRPHLRIGPGGAKWKKARMVPIWWDAGTLADLTAWRREREEQGARPNDPLVCCLWLSQFGHPLIRHTIRERFRTACKSLGRERLRGLTIHHGRHTFISHALAGGRTLAEVKQAAGHASLLTTSVYLHIAVEDEAMPGNLFATAAR